MTTDELSGALQRLKDVGFLAHLDETQIQHSYQEVRQRDGSPVDLLYSLPEIVYWFDSEYWWDPSVAASYVMLVTEIAAISRGAFAPENVSVTPDSDGDIDDGTKLLLSFEVSGGLYTQQLEFRGDAVDLHFIDLLNRALAEIDAEGRYYVIDTHDQTVLLIFLTPIQSTLAKELVGSDPRPWKLSNTFGRVPRMVFRFFLKYRDEFSK